MPIPEDGEMPPDDVQSPEVAQPTPASLTNVPLKPEKGNGDGAIAMADKKEKTGASARGSDESDSKSADDKNDDAATNKKTTVLSDGGDNTDEGSAEANDGAGQKMKKQEDTQGWVEKSVETET